MTSVGLRAAGGEAPHGPALEGTNMIGHRDKTGEASLDELMRWVREDLDDRPGALPEAAAAPAKPHRRWLGVFSSALGRLFAGRRPA